MENIGFVFGIMGLVFSMSAQARINALEKKLKERNILEKDYTSGKSF